MRMAGQGEAWRRPAIFGQWFPCIFRKGASDGEQPLSWRQSVTHFLKRADVTWSCRETRRVLDSESLEKMKSTYWLARIVFLRALAFVYSIAFLVAFNQTQGLIGSDGILPAQSYVASAREALAEESFWERLKAFPSLFLVLPANDFWIHCLPFVGLLVSVWTLVVGASSGFLMLLLWTLYQSVNSVGQVWFSFGWESQLLELGFLAIWLCPFWSFSRLPPSWPTPKVCIWGNRWLLFRLMLGAGLIKLRGDAAWRDLTALDYHYETQPLPSPFSWLMHHQSHGAHAFQVVVNHIVECVLCFLLILPFRQCRLFGGVVQILFQAAIIFSGNFAFLNHLTVVPAIMAFDDNFLACLFPSKTLERLPPLLQGCSGSWSLPKTQAWPLDALGDSNANQAWSTGAPHETAGLLEEKGGRPDWSMDIDVPPSEEPPRTCCCWYSPKIKRAFRSFARAAFPPRARLQLSEDIRQAWAKMLVEVVAACGLFTFMAFATQVGVPPLWSVLCSVFLSLLLAVSSAAYTKTLTSQVFVELVLISATLWSAISLFQHGPLAPCLWLAISLFTTLIVFSYEVLHNAALVYKVHVELLLLLLLISFSVPVVANLLSPNQIMNASLSNPFNIVNTYGAFGSVTKERWELIVQGTADAQPGNSSVWVDYEFKCKPGDVNRRPCLISPYHYRLDWLMWFVPMDDAQTAPIRHPWFPLFLNKLLQNSPSVTSLMAVNPFRGKGPPTAIRVLKRLYRFSNEPMFSSGPWWEVVPGSTEVFVSPSEVPDAERHLEKVLLTRMERRQEEEAERVRKEEAERREEERKAQEKAEEEEARREEERKKEEARKEEERKKEEARMEEERKKEEARMEEERRKEEELRAEEEKREREELEKRAREEEEARKKQEEEEKKRLEEEQKQEKQMEMELQKREAEERKKQEEERKKEEAAAKARAEAEEARRKKEEEEERKRQEQEAEMLQKAEEEEKKRKEALQKAEEEAAKRREEEAKKRDEEAAKQAEAREALRLAEEKKRQEELEKRHAEAAKRAEERKKIQSIAEREANPKLDSSFNGGVPLRAAAFFTKSKAAKMPQLYGAARRN
ncbi:putative rhoptry protein [Besnoitia besnoiti]|uniref:Putative rhoptry protein n=1 Tax=Besnoitia besnoiti TaxID=94643 RepID=A0A2A9MKH1_BESBE|nr:putative rhoptry protein [Besnoitia besnoiti]PFH35930.1 putative rhoptry protein [Besnoitia besnoiti]